MDQKDLIKIAVLAAPYNIREGLAMSVRAKLKTEGFERIEVFAGALIQQIPNLYHDRGIEVAILIDGGGFWLAPLQLTRENIPIILLETTQCKDNWKTLQLSPSRNPLVHDTLEFDCTGDALREAVQKVSINLRYIKPIG